MRIAFWCQVLIKEEFKGFSGARSRGLLKENPERRFKCDFKSLSIAPASTKPPESPLFPPSINTMYLLSLFLLAGIVKASSEMMNVTYPSSHSDFVYFKACEPNNPVDCDGAWWTEYDPKYTNGSVRVANDPTSKFSNIEPYFTFSFQGTGFYVYQWINKTSAAQVPFLGDGKVNVVDFVEGKNWQYPLRDEATLTMTWSKTGLEFGWYTIGVQHLATPPRQGFMVIDSIVVERPVNPPAPAKSSKKVIAGAVAGSVVGLLVIGALFFLYRREQARRAQARKNKFNLEDKAQTMNYMDPSSEIQASERLYSEAKREEEMQRSKGKGKEKDPMDSLPDINEVLRSTH
ncbi:hypothetical protein FRC02_010195 [Tulasnella sp. 418]|nr:hypothetical protein FRC02_010195 [Tulasnella sp. 418]